MRLLSHFGTIQPIVTAQSTSEINAMDKTPLKSVKKWIVPRTVENNDTKRNRAISPLPGQELKNKR